MRNQQGQSIVELIVAIAIGVILVVGGVAAISPILKISSNTARIQSASALGRELIENVRVLSEADWHAMDNLSMGAAYRYYIIASTSPFMVATGTESVVVSTTTYTRFFYLEDVYRNGGTPFEPYSGASVYDPSTKKVTVVYVWPPDASSTIVSYLTRANDEVFSPTDWSGGGNQSGPVTVTTTNAKFATSTSIDYATYPGSIVITGF